MRFRITKLERWPGSTSAREWQLPEVALKVNDFPWSFGSALFDTGLNQSFITVDAHLQQLLPTPREQHGTVLVAGAEVHLVVGAPEDPIAYYNVVVNDTTNVMSPAGGRFLPVNQGSAPFINTGRLFYRGFDVLFDAQCGWFGLRWRGGKNSPDGGLITNHWNGVDVLQQQSL